MAKSSTKIIELSHLLLCLFLMMSLNCRCVCSLNGAGAGAEASSNISSSSSSSMEVDDMMQWERSEEERYLAEKKKFITPGVLKRDQAVCNGGSRGQSYSTSCLPAPSNSYNRGCSKIYRCRS